MAQQPPVSKILSSLQQEDESSTGASAGSTFLAILKHAPSIDPSSEDNYALIWAVNHKHVPLLKYLLTDTRVDPSMTLPNHLPLKAAVQIGNTDMLRLLLNDERIDPNDLDGEGTTLLMYTIGEWDLVTLATFDYILTHPRVFPWSQNNAALRCAVERSVPGAVDVLLHYGSLVDPCMNDYALLYMACEFGDAPVLTLLMEDRRVQDRLTPQILVKHPKRTKLKSVKYRTYA